MSTKHTVKYYWHREAGCDVEVIDSDTDQVICNIPHIGSYKNSDLIAESITDFLNITNRTGKTPAQLEETNREEIQRLKDRIKELEDEREDAYYEMRERDERRDM